MSFRQAHESQPKSTKNNQNFHSFASSIAAAPAVSLAPSGMRPFNY
ncbi:hypothetical protein MRBBS_3490 [Marinobacter sp. BSs20148]|nr:hypothetical protein MRBBS_3490 [Marinobacter sp. BSs20148]